MLRKSFVFLIGAILLALPVFEASAASESLMLKLEKRAARACKLTLRRAGKSTTSIRIESCTIRKLAAKVNAKAFCKKKFPGKENKKKRKNCINKQDPDGDDIRKNLIIA